MTNRNLFFSFVYTYCTTFDLELVLIGYLFEKNGIIYKLDKFIGESISHPLEEILDSYSESFAPCQYPYDLQTGHLSLSTTHQGIGQQSPYGHHLNEVSKADQEGQEGGQKARYHTSKSRGFCVGGHICQEPKRTEKECVILSYAYRSYWDERNVK